MGGAAGGFLVGVLSSYALHKIYFNVYGIGLFESSLQSIWFGALMSILAQIGESLGIVIKENRGVKDSSHLPGFGGILDMVDSLVFTAPFLYYFLKLFLVRNS